MREMKVAYTISGIGHAAVLLWSVWSLSAKPLPTPPSVMMPVDIMSVSEFTQITAGNENAPKATPKPLVEKTAEVKPIEDVTAKVEKKEVQATREPPPAPEAKPVETKPAEAKPVEAKPAESKPEKKQAEAKPDPIAEALAKEEAKKPEPKKAEVKPPPPKKPAPPAPKFDAKEIQAKLLNKREATRVAAVGADLNSAPALGLPNASAKQLSLSELDAFRQRLRELWRLPPAAMDSPEVRSKIRIKLRRDGTLADGPMLISGGNTPLAIAARESAMRALFQGQPYDMFKPENYELWNDIEIDFNPRDFFGG
jgi:outer membrane biosynthesis protein TonB